MKKLLAVILSFFLLSLTCGCSFKPVFSPTAVESLVSAIGFSETSEGIEAFLETIVVNSEALGGEKELKILKGKGNSVFQAIDNAKNSASQGLELSHCAVIIIDQSLSPARFKDILEYCYNNNEITLSVLLITTENSLNLLNCSPVSSVAVGYDIVSSLENISLGSGIIYKNRFYELAALKEKPLNTFALPLFKVQKEEYKADGVAIYNNYEKITELTAEQTQLYSILTDNHSSGEFFVNDNRYKLNDVKVIYDFKYTNHLEIILSIDINSEIGNTNALKHDLLNELETSKILYSDIFGFGNLIQYFDNKIWASIKNNYTEIYKNSAFTVKLNEN